MFRTSSRIEWCPTRICVFSLRNLSQHPNWVRLDWHHSWLHRARGRSSHHICTWLLQSHWLRHHWLLHHLLRCDEVLRIRLDSVSHFRFRLDSFLNIITLTRRLPNFAKIVTKGSLSFFSCFLLSLLSLIFFFRFSFGMFFIVAANGNEENQD